MVDWHDLRQHLAELLHAAHEQICEWIDFHFRHRVYYTTREKQLMHKYLKDFCFSHRSTHEDVRIVLHHWEKLNLMDTKQTKDGTVTSIVQLFDIYYGFLFDLAPEVRPLFRNSIKIQGKALMNVVGGVKTLLQSDDPIAKAAQIAQRHVAYGVRCEYFNSIGIALIKTLDALAPELFTPESRHAWGIVFCQMSLLVMVQLDQELRWKVKRASRGSRRSIQSLKESCTEWVKSQRSMLLRRELEKAEGGLISSRTAVACDQRTSSRTTQGTSVINVASSNALVKTNESSQAGTSEPTGPRESVNEPRCPFSGNALTDVANVKEQSANATKDEPRCPFSGNAVSEVALIKQQSIGPSLEEPRCPFSGNALSDVASAKAQPDQQQSLQQPQEQQPEQQRQQQQQQQQPVRPRLLSEIGRHSHRQQGIHMQVKPPPTQDQEGVVANLLREAHESLCELLDVHRRIYYSRVEKQAMHKFLQDFCFRKRSTREDVRLVLHHWEQLNLMETKLTSTNGKTTSIVQLFDIYYKFLFELAPETKPLFRNSIKIQGKSLMNVVGGIKTLLQSDDPITKAAQIAQRHVGYGVRCEYFNSLGLALMKTLDVLAPELFTAPTRRAWSAVFCQVSLLLVVPLDKHLRKKAKAASSKGKRYSLTLRSAKESYSEWFSKKSQREAYLRAELHRAETGQEPSRTESKASSTHGLFSEATTAIGTAFTSENRSQSDLRVRSHGAFSSSRSSCEENKNAAAGGGGAGIETVVEVIAEPRCPFSGNALSDVARLNQIQQQPRLSVEAKCPYHRNLQQQQLQQRQPQRPTELKVSVEEPSVVLQADNAPKAEEARTGVLETFNVSPDDLPSTYNDPALSKDSPSTSHYIRSHATCRLTSSTSSKANTNGYEDETGTGTLRARLEPRSSGTAGESPKKSPTSRVNRIVVGATDEDL